MRYASFVQSLAASGSDAWALHTRAQERKRAGDPVIVLSVGDPDFETPAGIVEACKEALDAGATKYSVTGGIHELTTAIAAEESARLGIGVEPSDVVVTAGAQNALYVTMRCILEPGDEAILLAPPYVMFDGVVLGSGATPVHVPLKSEAGFAIDLEALENAITPRTRVILMNSPHNPSGAVADEGTVRRVLEICKKHDIWLISDEVYADLCFEDDFGSPYTMEGGRERTIVIRSMSKSHAMSGWRIGWLLGPAALCEHTRNLLTSIQYGGSAFIQHAAAHGLRHEGAAREAMKQAYKARREILVGNLANLPGLNVLRPSAGIFCLADVGALGLDGAAFAEKLFDAELVSVLAGGAYGPTLTNHVRISLCQPEPVLVEATDRIRAFVMGLRETPAA